MIKLIIQEQCPDTGLWQNLKEFAQTNKTVIIKKFLWWSINHYGDLTPSESELRRLAKNFIDNICYQPCYVNNRIEQYLYSIYSEEGTDYLFDKVIYDNNNWI